MDKNIEEVIKNSHEFEDWKNKNKNDVHVNNSMFTTHITQKKVINPILKIKDYYFYYENICSLLLFNLALNSGNTHCILKKCFVTHTLI